MEIKQFDDILASEKRLENESTDPGNDVDENFPSDFIENRILALCLHSDCLGIAIYVESENVIKISHDISASHGEIEYIMEMIKSGLNPSMIIMTKNMANNIELLDLIVSPLTEGNNIFSYQILKNIYWDYSSAIRSSCTNLKVRELLQTDSAITKNVGILNSENDIAYNLLSGSIDFNAVQSIRALGALIGYLQATIFSLEVDGTVPVYAIREVDYLSCLRIDLISLRSLGIFNEESHPNVLKEKGHSKEGFSLFALYDRTKSMIGRRYLKEWFSRPSTDISIIQARQDGIELLMKSENAELVQCIRKSLGRSFDLPHLLLRVKRVVATYLDWCKIIQSAEAAHEIYDMLILLKKRTLEAAHVAFLQSIIENICDPAMLRIIKTLSAVIDVQSSLDEKDIMLKFGLSQKLDELRTIYSNLNGILHQIGTKVLHENPLFDEISVEYVPQVGYLIAISGRSRDFVPPDFQFAFTQEDTTFYKNDIMLQLDFELGDIQADIADCKACLVRELEDYLLSEEVNMQKTWMSLARLDAISSLASAAVDFNLVRPAVVHENVIIIKDGRHPLQELVVESFIPNDTLLASTVGGTVALITGPNYSGKSIYLKQVGVLVYLTHVGSFISCSKAIIGLTDRIFTRVLSVESCTLPQSSFTIDMAQCSKMLRHSTNRSLLLIDEFGKGTNALDGASLLAALIMKIGGTGEKTNCKALLTLHFLEVFREGLIGLNNDKPGFTDCEGVLAFHMKIHASDSVSQAGVATSDAGGVSRNSDAPIPLFKLLPGVAHSSYGFFCAKKGNVPEDIIQRAETVMNLFTFSNESIEGTSGEKSNWCWPQWQHEIRTQGSERVLNLLFDSDENEGILLEEDFVKSMMTSVFS